MADTISTIAAEHPHAPSPVVQRYKTSFVEVVIAGIAVQTLLHLGKIWFRLLDLNRVFEYKSARTSAIRNALERRGFDFMSNVLRVSEGRNSAIFISEDHVRLICKINVADRTNALREWLESGCLDQLKGGDQPTGDIRSAAQHPSEGHTEQASATAQSESPSHHSRRQVYCRELTRLIVRYGEPAEIEQLSLLLESASRSITRQRPCQGLNDASYAAFARYMLA